MEETLEQIQLERIYAQLVDISTVVKDKNEYESLKRIIFKLGSHITRTYYDDEDIIDQISNIK